MASLAHLAGVSSRRGAAGQVVAPDHFRVELFLASRGESVEVLTSAGLRLSPRLFLRPGQVRLLMREGVVHAPRGHTEYFSVRVSAPSRAERFSITWRAHEGRDRLPRALDNCTTRLEGTTIRHAWPAGEWHPWAPENMDEPLAEA